MSGKHGGLAEKLRTVTTCVRNEQTEHIKT